LQQNASARVHSSVWSTADSEIGYIERRWLVKKKETKKLTLSKETLVQLNGMDLRNVAGGSGGGWSDNSVCPTTTPSDCRPCY
jgi:hypothetical protein